jgi:hypothetical protein
LMDFGSCLQESRDQIVSKSFRALGLQQLRALCREEYTPKSSTPSKEHEVKWKHVSMLRTLELSS